MNAEQLVIHQTKCWVKTVVAGCNFCPFAKRELERESIRYSVIHENTHEACMQAVIDECVLLDCDSAIETTLLIFPAAFEEFYDYLQLVEIAGRLLEQQGYQGTYQLASFHPEYRFADTEIDDAANFTNRSPYPMLHLIREASIEKALQQYPDAEHIPERNIEYARSKGLNTMQGMLDDCRKVEKD